MSKKIVFLVIAAFIATFHGWSIDISMADLYHYNPDGMPVKSKNVSEDIINYIVETDIRCIIKMDKVDSEKIPKSVLEVKSLSTKNSLNYILYGFLKEDQYSLDLEVKLYDHESGRINKIFYSKNNLDRYDELIETLGNRVIDYFYKDLGAVRFESKEDTSSLKIDAGLGYWFPFEPYAETTMGLGTFHTGLTFYPKEPLFRRGLLGFSLGFGLSLDYFLGMNKTGYESFSLHTGKIGLPINFAMVWNDRNRVVFSLAPGLLMDVVNQDRLYSGTHTEMATTFVATTGLGYEYLVGKNKGLAIGIFCNAGVAFFEEPQLTLYPSLVFRF